MSHTHLLLTRFNVRESEEFKLALDEKWLDGRVKLFEEYCLPSVQKQTDSNFKWVILWDGETPQRFRDLEGKYSALLKCELHFEYLTSWYDYNNLSPVLSKYIDEGSSCIVTSRVDNDDALAANYISEVKSHIESSDTRYFISFTCGAQYFSEYKTLFNILYKRNHFTSLVEPAGEPFFSVLKFNHNDLNADERVMHIDTPEPMWLELVHGGNLLNSYTPKYKYSICRTDTEAVFGVKTETTSAWDSIITLRKMRRSHYIQRLTNYRLVFSNYLFGTSATAANAIISLLIYPYVIRVLGIEQYGIYAFALVIVNTIIQIESIPFSLPFGRDASAAKSTDERSAIFSTVMTSKLILIAVSSIIFLPLVLLLPQAEPYRSLMVIIFLSILANPFMPNWYYNAIQKTKVIAYIQISVRLLSIPFVLLFITKPEHLIRYAIIYTACSLLCAIISFVYLKAGEKLRIRLVSASTSLRAIKRCLPTFMDGVSNMLNSQLAGILTGALFGMAEMTFYDLANKITQIISYGTAGINDALMPHVIRKGAPVRKIMQYECVLCLLILAATAVLGKPVILMLGGTGMDAAYPLTLILTVALCADFLSNGIVGLSLVPQRRFKEIPYGRYVALAVFVLCIPAAFNLPYTFIVAAIAAASVARLIFTAYQVSAHR